MQVVSAQGREREDQSGVGTSRGAFGPIVVNNSR